MQKVFLSVFLLLALVNLAGCTQSRNAASSDSLTVEGIVSMRGHEPFTALVLETDERNSYVLTLDEQDRTEIMPQTPGAFQMTGKLYEDNWNGKPYAHLRVQEWKPRLGDANDAD